MAPPDPLDPIANPNLGVILSWEEKGKWSFIQADWEGGRPGRVREGREAGGDGRSTYLREHGLFVHG